MRVRLAGIVVSLAALLVASEPRADVAELVAQVSQANLAAHIGALEFERASAAQQALAADYIEAQLQGFGYSVARIPVSTSENLEATLPGTRYPGLILIVGAHFDSVAGSPGADDNASGVAGTLEIARVLAGASLESTIRFVFFGLEEAGLVGSQAYAQAAALAGDNITGMLDLEMIGYTCGTPGCQVPFGDIPSCLDVEPEGVDVGTHIAVLANSASAGLLDEYLSAASTYVPALEVGSGVVAGTGACFPDTRRSDHAPFWDRGYLALMIGDTANFRNPNYHQATDTLATLDLAFATNVTRATLAAAVIHTGLVPPQIPLLPRWARLLFVGLLLAVSAGAAPRLRAKAGFPERSSNPMTCFDPARRS